MRLEIIAPVPSQRFNGNTVAGRVSSEPTSSSWASAGAVASDLTFAREPPRGRAGRSVTWDLSSLL